MIRSEFKFKSDPTALVTNQTVDGFLHVLAEFKSGALDYFHASIDGVELDINHLLEVLDL